MTTAPEGPVTPLAVPNLRLHLLEKWVPGGRFVTLVGRMVAGNAASAAAWERRVLRQASLWWVGEEMATVTAAASASIPDDVTPADLVMPSEQSYGMAVLAKPWLGLDANDDEHSLPVDVVVWGHSAVGPASTPALSLSFYRYFDFAAGLDGVELGQAIESGAILDGRPENPSHSGGLTTVGLTGGAWAYIGRSDWLYGRALTDTSDFPAVDADPTKRASYVEDRRWFSAFSLLVNHRLAEQETVYAPRPLRRRAQREGISGRDISDVRLIRLRQPKRAARDTEADAERRRVEWTHRWVVDGHPAWRRCGPGHTQRRLVYIVAHVKGPQDKPLIVKTNVHMWVQ